jgi:hypothetical protein
MKPLYKGLILAAVQIALVASLGGKLLVDRATRPRVWVKAQPVDPFLPIRIRGRYVNLTLDATAQMVPVPGTASDARELRLRPAEPPFKIPNRVGVAFFIPEGVPDPSLRPAGEELWVEVTVPKKGPPRPIRLGVKKGDVLSVLDLD